LYLFPSFHLVPRLKNERSYTSIPQYAFMAWCSVKAQEQVYLYLQSSSNVCNAILSL
jgi:hypothetical protein